MISIKTASGLELTFPRKKLDDWETMKLLRDIDKGEDFKLIDLCERLFDDDIEKIKEHVKDEDGDVTFTAMAEEIALIFSAVKELKN